MTARTHIVTNFHKTVAGETVNVSFFAEGCRHGIVTTELVGQNLHARAIVQTAKQFGHHPGSCARTDEGC